MVFSFKIFILKDVIIMNLKNPIVQNYILCFIIYIYIYICFLTMLFLKKLIRSFIYSPNRFKVRKLFLYISLNFFTYLKYHYKD